MKLHCRGPISDTKIVIAKHGVSKPLCNQSTFSESIYSYIHAQCTYTCSVPLCFSNQSHFENNSFLALHTNKYQLVELPVYVKKFGLRPKSVYFSKFNVSRLVMYTILHRKLKQCYQWHLLQYPCLISRILIWRTLYTSNITFCEVAISHFTTIQL